VQISLFNLGLSRTYASRGALVVNAVPFLVLIFAHFYIPGDRITRQKLAGMAIGFCGVALVLTDTHLVATQLRSGDFIILAAATIWGLNAVYTKTVIDRFQPFHLVLYPMLLAIPLLFLAGWLWDGAMIVYVDAAILTAMIFQSLICAAIGFVAWNTLLQRYGASTLHSFIFIMPVAGVAAGALVLGEPLTRNLLAAVILIAAGIALVNFRRKPLTPVLPVGRPP
jgi:drug/metabolite transporter (DMT)-like permease